MIDGLFLVGLEGDGAGGAKGEEAAGVTGTAAQRHERAHLAAHASPGTAWALLERDGAGDTAADAERDNQAATGSEFGGPGGGDRLGTHGGDNPVVAGVIEAAGRGVGQGHGHGRHAGRGQGRPCRGSPGLRRRRRCRRGRHHRPCVAFRDHPSALSLAAVPVPAVGARQRGTVVTIDYEHMPSVARRHVMRRYLDDIVEPTAAAVGIDDVMAWLRPYLTMRLLAIYNLATVRPADVTLSLALLAELGDPSTTLTDLLKMVPEHQARVA